MKVHPASCPDYGQPPPIWCPACGGWVVEAFTAQLGDPDDSDHVPGCAMAVPRTADVVCPAGKPPRGSS